MLPRSLARPAPHSASIASASSAPSARDVDRRCPAPPRAAAGPRMLLPSTVRCAARRRESGSRKLPASFTNRAAARACRPSALTIVSRPRRHSALVAPRIAIARAADRTPRESPRARARTARARQRGRSPASGAFASLISIGRFTPVTTSTRPASRNVRPEIRRRAAEHVGEEQHAARRDRRARSRARSPRAPRPRRRASRSTPR